MLDLSMYNLFIRNTEVKFEYKNEKYVIKMLIIFCFYR